MKIAKAIVTIVLMLLILTVPRIIIKLLGLIIVVSTILKKTLLYFIKLVEREFRQV